MAKFISVLDTHLGLSFWQAVQWADDLNSLENNRFYTAGVDKSIPKSPGSKQVGHKKIIERSTGQPAGATMVQLSTRSQHLLALASGKASEKVIASLTETIDKPNTD